MKKLKILFVLLSVVLFSCSLALEKNILIESNFPLRQSYIFSVDEVVQKVAVTDTWFAIYTPGKLTGVEIETQATLWSLDSSVRADTESEFQIIDDTLIAASTNQVFLVNKSGQKLEINLEPKEEDIIRLIALYPNYLYVIRGPNWRLEVYDFHRNVKLWSMLVGRGGADVFYDDSQNIAYVTTRDNFFHALNNTTGEVVWKQDRSSLHSAFEKEILYAVAIGSDKDTFRFSAFDVNSQKELWENEIPSIAQIYELTIIDKFLIASGSEGLIAIDKSNGNVIWRTPTGEKFYTRPIEFDGVIYAKGASHTVYAISPRNGDFVGFVRLEAGGDIQPMHEIFSGVYKFNDGILFNTRNAIVVYRTR